MAGNGCADCTGRGALGVASSLGDAARCKLKFVLHSCMAFWTACALNKCYDSFNISFWNISELKYQSEEERRPMSKWNLSVDLQICLPSFFRASAVFEVCWFHISLGYVS